MPLLIFLTLSWMYNSNK